MEFHSHNGALLLNGKRFHLKGCSWFGFETDTKCVHGLWAHSVHTYLDFLASYKFNALRLPFTAELALALDQTQPSSIDYHKNPTLKGLSAGAVMDYIIAEAARRGMLVLLDMHCLTCKDGITDLWYTDSFPEDKLLHAWSLIVSRYEKAWNVFGADLKNEPHDSATWGDGNLRTDWRLAAQRIGNAVLSINPRLLIFVEGTSGVQTPITTPEAAFWGGSLASARLNPVELSVPQKLVYSPHVYGPGIWMQDYFKTSSFPRNMPSIWVRQWAHLLESPKAGPAVVVGEWGGYFKPGGLEATWAEALVQFMRDVGATDQFFWCLNPNSGDTGGLLEGDWTMPAAHKLDLLHQLCPAPSKIEVDAHGQPLGVAGGGGAPAAMPPQHHQHAAQHHPPEPAPAPSTTGSQAQVTRAGVQGLVLDVSGFPGLEVSARIVSSWQEGQGGHKFQVEATMRNGHWAPMHGIRVDVEPRGSVQQVWHMKLLDPGGVLGMMDYWASCHGFKPGDTITWGGIFHCGNLRLVFSPS